MPKSVTSASDAAKKAWTRKTTFCMFHLQGVCSRPSERCAFAHSVEEMDLARRSRKKRGPKTPPGGAASASPPISPPPGISPITPTIDEPMFVDAAVVRPPMAPTNIPLPSLLTHEPAKLPSRGLSCLDTFSMSVAHLEMAVERLKMTRGLQMYNGPDGYGPSLDDTPALVEIANGQQRPSGQPPLYPYESLQVDSLQAQSILDLQAILSMTRDEEFGNTGSTLLRMR